MTVFIDNSFADQCQSNNPKTPNIKYVSAASGSGKTYVIMQQGIANAKGHNKTIIVLPTIVLIDEVIKTYAPTVPYKVFNHETCVESVVKELLNFFNSDAREELIFVTHAGLFQLPYVPNASEWTVYIDEAPQVLKSFSFRIPCTHKLLSDHFDKFDQAGAIYSELRPNTRLQEIADNEREDEIFAKLGEWVRTVCNGNWCSYIHDEELARLLADEFDFFQPQCILDPELLHRFREVTILSANFEETLCYKLWSTMNVNFVEHTAFVRELREVPTSAELIIKYCLDKPWSAKKADKVIEGKNIRQWMIEIIEKDMRERGLTGILTLDNKKHDNEELFSWANSAPLPQVSHGLNTFQDYNNVVMLGAYNPPPHTIKFLKHHFCLDAADIKDGIMHQNLYQAAMRSSLRDPNNHDQKIIYVPDKGCAEYLAGIYNNATFSKFGAMSEPKTGRPRKHASDKERMATKRQELRKQKARDMDKQLLLVVTTKTSTDKNCSESPYNISYKGINEHNCRGDVCFGSIFNDIYSETPAFYISSLPFSDQIKLLHELWSRVISEKEAVALISPSTFKPDEIGNARKYEHIVAIRNVWFDFEEGDLSPEAFGELFPRSKFLIFNSYRHTKEKPRFRVVMFTSSAVTIEAYKIIYEMVRKKLQEAGYHTKVTQPHKTMKKSGLDWSKHPPTSLFYLPTQAELSEDSFFHVYDDDDRETIDVMAWLENYHEPVVVEDVSDIAEPVNDIALLPINEAKERAVLDRWRFAPKNTGNNLWKELAWGLATANVPLPEIERHLHAELFYAPTKHRRKLEKQIKPLIAYIQKHFRPRNYKEGEM
jgi:hypothetical protein